MSNRSIILLYLPSNAVAFRVMFQGDRKVSTLVELPKGCGFSWSLPERPGSWRAHYLGDTERREKERESEWETEIVVKRDR